VSVATLAVGAPTARAPLASSHRPAMVAFAEIT
jgi:hypothetical protein